MVCGSQFEAKRARHTACPVSDSFKTNGGVGTSSSSGSRFSPLSLQKVSGLIGDKLAPMLEMMVAAMLIPVFARIARGQTLSAKQREYVEAARVTGAGTPTILFRHILPNIVSPLLLQASLPVAGAVLAEASLSGLGLGTQPPMSSWGAMVDEGQPYLERQPWLGIFPALAVFLVVLGFNLFGNGLGDALDPRLRT